MGICKPLYIKDKYIHCLKFILSFIYGYNISIIFLLIFIFVIIWLSFSFISYSLLIFISNLSYNSFIVLFGSIVMVVSLEDFEFDKISVIINFRGLEKDIW